MHCAHKEWNERGSSAPQSWPGINLPCCSTRSESREHPGWAYQRKYQSGVPHRGARLLSLGSRHSDCGSMVCDIGQPHIQRLHSQPRLITAGGAMAMKLSGASDSTIMRVGRWSSLTYLTYIIYPFANRSTDGWGGMKDVNGFHISKCRVINRVRQLNEVGRRH